MPHDGKIKGIVMLFKQFVYFAISSKKPMRFLVVLKRIVKKSLWFTEAVKYRNMNYDVQHG